MTDAECTELAEHWRKFVNLETALAGLMEKGPLDVTDADCHMLDVANIHVTAWERVLAK